MGHPEGSVFTVVGDARVITKLWRDVVGGGAHPLVVAGHVEVQHPVVLGGCRGPVEVLVPGENGKQPLVVGQGPISEPILAIIGGTVRLRKHAGRGRGVDGHAPCTCEVVGVVRFDHVAEVV